MFVDYTDEKLGQGVFGLRQGLQRRVSMTMVHYSGSNFVWKGISQVTLGRVRTLREVAAQQVSNSSRLPLNILPTDSGVHDTGVVGSIKVEVAWDRLVICLIHQRAANMQNKTKINIFLFSTVPSAPCTTLFT